MPLAVHLSPRQNGAWKSGGGWGVHNLQAPFEVSNNPCIGGSEGQVILSQVWRRDLHFCKTRCGIPTRTCADMFILGLPRTHRMALTKNLHMRGASLLCWVCLSFPSIVNPHVTQTLAILGVLGVQNRPSMVTLDPSGRSSTSKWLQVSIRSFSNSENMLSSNHM